MKKIKLPDFFKQYFWDVDFQSLDFKKNKTFILKRLLDRGNTQSLIWLEKNYNRKEIEVLLKNTRDLSPKTATFWADYLKLDHNKVICLQKPYSRTPFGLSS
ncbi:MAG: hypothetical protein Q7R43_02170 [Candidatus Daviesbacteria bacterium]|nr:hypothetical protein [Candidatus Daviesbacteria bacterium]